MTVPLIGIVADRKSASYGAWVDIPTDAISHTYVAAIQEAGGAPVLFPSLDVHVDDPERLLDLVDGLFLPGGRDLDASLYASEAHPSNDKPLRVRDELEIALTRLARERDMPGARRLSRDAGAQRGARRHARAAPRRSPRPHAAPRRGTATHTSHPVAIEPGTLLQRHHARARVRHLVAPPPGRRRARRGARGLGERARRRRRGDRGRSTARSASACSGIPRSGSTPRASRSSARSSPRRARGRGRSSRCGRRARVARGCCGTQLPRGAACSGSDRPWRLASPRSCACAT